MNKAYFLLSALSLAVLPALAKPSVGDVTLTQHPDTRRVEIAYTLANEPAIVTLDIQTNGVSIGAAHFADAFGDLNDVVRPTEGDEVRRIWWQPDVSWAFNRVTDGSLKAVLTAWATNAPPDYVVYDLNIPNSRTFYASVEQIPGGVTNAVYKESKLVMRRIPAAGVRWRMGSPVGEIGRNNANETAHYVTLTKDFYMAVYPWTQRQHMELTGAYMATYTRSVSLPNCDWRPVENKCAFNDVRGGETVTAGSYIGKLRDRTGQKTFDLPTEARWEFACRAGSPAALYLGTEAHTNYFDRIGWRDATGDTGDSCVQPVGFLEPNAFGLYDMLGTVLELCLDWYQADLGPAEAVDPVGPDAGTVRVVRGVGMHVSPSTSTPGYLNARTARRDSLAPTSGNLSTGFRPVCEAIFQ